MSKPFSLPRGILSVLQTPFDTEGNVDETSLERLIDDAIAVGVDGFLVPAVASEVNHLSDAERETILKLVSSATAGRVPLIAGASAGRIEQSKHFARVAERTGAVAYLVAVPQQLYGHLAEVLPFFQSVASATSLPLIIQDLEWNGPGLPLDTITALRDTVRTLAGLKIETVPAGPKYSIVRNCFGSDFFISGGWAITQMIEALDRGVDAMVPESSMVKVYAAIYRTYMSGNRSGAVRLFHSLLPVLAFTNQEIWTSIAFFKRLLVRRGIFANAGLRNPNFAWDEYNSRIADELIDLYLELHTMAGGKL